MASVMIVLLSLSSFTRAQWQNAEEFYYENRSSGLQVYYSPTFYAEKDPVNKNYREYRYDKDYGKDYYWENYDGGIYSEREFIARYNQLTYYTDNNDDLTDWGQQMGVAGAIAGGCCILICAGVLCTQCIVRRRKRQKELKAAKELAEQEGIEMEKSQDSGESEDDQNESSKGDTDDLAATQDKRKRKKSTKSKRKEALEKKGMESKNDPTVVADFSRDDVPDADGSRREMIAQSDTVRADDADNRGPVGNKRFDVNDDGASEMPQGNEEGGGFF